MYIARSSHCPHNQERIMMSTPESGGAAHRRTEARPPFDETFRATLQGHTPDGEPATIIVTRQGLGLPPRGGAGGGEAG